MLPSAKVEKFLNQIRKDQLTHEELHELLKALARYLNVSIKVEEETDNDDFWDLSEEDKQQFEKLVDQASKDLKNKKYTEYSKPQA